MCSFAKVFRFVQYWSKRSLTDHTFIQNIHSFVPKYPRWRLRDIHRWSALIQNKFRSVSALLINWKSPNSAENENFRSQESALIQGWTALISSETELISADVFHVLWISAEKRQNYETALFSRWLSLGLQLWVAFRLYPQQISEKHSVFNSHSLALNRETYEMAEISSRLKKSSTFGTEKNLDL